MNQENAKKFLNKVANYYHSKIDSEKAQEFFSKRKLVPELVEKFQLGFSTGNDMEMLGERDSYEMSKSLGLISYKDTEEGRLQFPYFRNRIMFPFHDLNGDVVGFTGRALNAEAIPKYLNSRESEIYNKSIVLYGMFQSCDVIFKYGSAFIVEGNIDTIRMYEKGYPVIGLSSHNMSDFQISILASLHVKTYLLLDGDKAGREGASLITRKFHDFNKSVRKVRIPRYVELPEGYDPDKFLLTYPNAEDYINEQVFAEKFAPRGTQKIYYPKEHTPEYFKESFDIKAIKANVNIADIIGSRIELRRSGSNLIAKCPFHEEKTGSFMVSEAKQIYKCFGCGASGDVLKFLIEYDKMSFKDAVFKLKNGG